MDARDMLVNHNDSILLIIDFQPKLAQAIADSEAALQQCVKLLHGANTLGIPVIASEQYPKGLGHTDMRLAALLSDKTPIIDKTCFSCTGAHELTGALSNAGKHQIIIGGMEAHVCVLQSAAQLQTNGFNVFVVEDAICSRSNANKANAIERMRAAAINITNTESVLFEWMRDAKNPHFKSISALIK